MSNDILENVTLIIINMIVGSVIVILGLYFQSGFLVFLGGMLAGTLPILKLILFIIESS